MLQLMEELKSRGFAEQQLLTDEPMARHTTMRVGGKADLMVLPGCVQQIQEVLELAELSRTPCMVIGAGSNLIVGDGGIRGLVVKLGEMFSRIVRQEDGLLIAQAGAKLSQLGAEALKAGLTGLEFASGIPGTVGGGVAMNAGAYGGELKDCLVWADLLMDNQVVRLPVAEMEMGYRTSLVQKKKAVVLQAAFSLEPGDVNAISEKMQQLAQRRREKQPLNYPSSGSTFKRPQGHFAGALIEGAGLKGFSVGGAQVSEKHAGFVINAGGASARDVITLIEQVKEKVLAHSGVALECEVRIVGER